MKAIVCNNFGPIQDIEYKEVDQPKLDDDSVIIDVKSVGVMGDNRTYDNTVCVRVVEAVDGMTATFAHLPHDLLERISRRIINEVDGINRVVYDISSKPPATIEWE